LFRQIRQVAPTALSESHGHGDGPAGGIGDFSRRTSFAADGWTSDE
jgi:hypothetical protein